MKIPFALWFSLLVLAFLAMAIRKGEQIQAAGTPPWRPYKPNVARCTPFADGSCGACTTCNYCQWCNANPDNHCTTCLSTRAQGKKSTAKSLATPPQPPTFPAPETAPKAQEISPTLLAQAPATPSPSIR